MIWRSIAGPGMKYTGGHSRFFRIQPGAASRQGLPSYTTLLVSSLR